MKKIISYLRAGFPAFWLKTTEPDRVRGNVYDMLRSFERKDGGKYSILEWTYTTEPNPIKSLEQLNQAEDCTILFAYNFHWVIDKPQVIQTIQDNLASWSNTGKAIVCVSPMEKIPLELQKHFLLLDLPLPNESEILNAITHISPDSKMIPTDDKLTRLVSSCKGFTRIELEQVLALSFVETGGTSFSRDTINDYKAMTIRKTGFLDILSPTINFSNIIGYENIKRFVMETIDNPKAKGIMTIGPPGCGKTSLMKAIVGETGKFGLSVNMGKLFSKYQGETDSNIDTVINLITAIGDCLVLIDEFEKQFAGAGSDGSLDSGTTRRATGRWLDFLQDRPKGVYIVGTANSFAGIPGEYIRPGRWDSSPFFIDLPTQKVKMDILRYYIKKTGIPIPEKQKILGSMMKDFSGAEIEALVHIADMRNMSLENAAKCIIPQAKTMAENVNALREWAKERTIPAEDIPPTGIGKRQLDV
jgi:hypothetical protein